MYIRVENNFLQADELRADALEETHRLCNFWCGYIHGFFESALPLISDLMADLSGPKSARVTLPAYHKVVSVSHLQDDILTEDVFCVQFAPEPLSHALATLRDSRWPLKERKYSVSMRACQSALISARVVLGSEFEARLNKLNIDFASLSTVSKMLSGEFPQPIDESIAVEWFKVANQVIKHLSLTER